jgi:1,4-alpha-glucan branching enzyme
VEIIGAECEQKEDLSMPKTARKSDKTTAPPRKVTRKRSAGMKKAGDHPKVKFTIHAPDAKQVNLAGDFNQWDPGSLPLVNRQGGRWSREVKLPPGRYEYKFLCDDCWVENLTDVEGVQNDYGTYNLVIQV